MCLVVSASQLVDAVCELVLMCVFLCVCCHQVVTLSRPVKVMCGDYLESGGGRLSHCSPLIFYMVSLFSLIIFYMAAITNCLEKKRPPAKHTHKHAHRSSLKSADA